MSFPFTSPVTFLISNNLVQFSNQIGILLAVDTDAAFKPADGAVKYGLCNDLHLDEEISFCNCSSLNVTFSRVSVISLLILDI